MNDKEWKEDFEFINSFTLNDFDEGEYSVQDLLRYKGIANKYMQLVDDVDTLLMRIYRYDKTKDYGYGNLPKNQDSLGNFPPSGKRWLTPKELIRNHYGESNFWEIWENFTKLF